MKNKWKSTPGSLLAPVHHIRKIEMIMMTELDYIFGSCMKIWNINAQNMMQPHFIHRFFFSVFLMRFKSWLHEYWSVRTSSVLKSEVKINSTSSISSTHGKLVMLSHSVIQPRAKEDNNVIRKLTWKKGAVMVTFSLNSLRGQQQSQWLWMSLTPNAVAGRKSTFCNKMFEEWLKIMHERLPSLEKTFRSQTSSALWVL